MRALAKVAGVLVLLALGLAAAAPFLLKKFLPPERVRSIVLAQAQKALGREVRLASVSYSLKGISLEELAVSERPNFAAGTFLAVKRFHASAALLPLLKKTLVVDRVEADGLRLIVVRHADGSYNFSDLVKPSATAGSAAPAPGGQSGGAQGFTLGVKAARIADGRLEYRDERAGDDLKISGVTLKAKGIRLSGPFDLDAAARVKGKRGGAPIEAAASVSGRVDLGGQDPRKFSADLKKLSLEYAGYLVKGALKVEGLEDISSRADLSFSRDGRALAELHWSGKARKNPAAGLGVEAEGTLKLKTSAMRAGELADLGGPKTGLIPPLRASGAIALKGSGFSARGLLLETPVGRVTLDGGVRGLGTAAIEPDFSAVLALDLPQIHASQLPAGTLPKGLSLPPMSVSGGVRVKGDSAVFDKVRAQLKQGTIEVSGSAMALRSGKPKLDLEVAAKLDLPELYASDLSFASLPKTFKSPAMAVDGKVRVKGEEAHISSLRLRGKAGTVDVSGVVKGLPTAPEPELDVVAKLSLPALKAADAPFLPLPEGFALPASRWDADLFASRDEVRFKTLRAVVGTNDVEISAGKVTGLRSQKPVAALTIKCRQFALEELADLTPAIREMAVKGTGFFGLSIVGPLDKPLLGGKLQFRTISALVSGLKLEDFTGTASFDERRIDVPNLRGKVDGSDLHLDLTVKNYAAKPDVDLQATLAAFDLGKFFGAKAQMSASRDASAQAQGRPKPSEKPATPINLKGKLAVGRLFHPNFEAKDVRASWELADYTPDYKTLGGWAKFDVVGGGYLKDLGKVATQGKLVKALLSPLIVIQKIGRLLGKAVFANFDDVSYTELSGDYAFASGLMRLNKSSLRANVGDVEASGAIDLPAERLDMTVIAQLNKVTPVEIAVTGTFDDPKTHLKINKVLKETLENTGRQLIEGLLKRR